MIRLLTSLLHHHNKHGGGSAAGHAVASRSDQTRAAARRTVARVEAGLGAGRRGGRGGTRGGHAATKEHARRPWGRARWWHSQARAAVGEQAWPAARFRTISLDKMRRFYSNL